MDRLPEAWGERMNCEEAEGGEGWRLIYVLGDLASSAEPMVNGDTSPQLVTSFRS